MIIKTAEFIKGSVKVDQCPKPDLPEFAFIGRSNVGKSSLINMITGFGKLAKISSTPGKTREINHFLINKEWYLVDLPGYGYAQTNLKQREILAKIIREYIVHRENLYCLFVLVDSRHEPQKVDIEFINNLGHLQVPFNIILTKSDKIPIIKLNSNIDLLKKELLNTWESLPEIFSSSSFKVRGKDEILSYISNILKNK